MSTCQIKTGIFTLKECGKHTVETCSSCGIPVCNNHSRTLQDGQHLCTACYAKQEQNNPNSPHNTSSYYFQDDFFSHYLWYETFRSDFNSHYDYEPFDSNDFEGFENETAADFDDETDDNAFFDS